MRSGKSFGLVAFTALLIAILAFSISITQTYVSDTDASTYVIVPMLMLPIFAVFMLKESDNIVPKAGNKDIILGTVLFVLFMVMALDARAYLGPLFFSYRMDMLLLPIAIAALASLIFGAGNLGRFAWIAIYALTASPLMLLPAISMNLGFASLNSLAIYYAASPFLHGMGFVAPITVSYAGYLVSIGNSCIGIGALIALVLFMIPIAYFLEGRTLRKLLWVLSGLLLMLVLNFLRMLAITVAWFAYGPNQGVLNIHAVIGEAIFYAVILVMILMAGRYGLSYPRLGLGKKRYEYSALGISLAVLFSLLYLLVSASYQSAAIVPIGSIGSGAVLNWDSASAFSGAYLRYNGSAYSALGTGNRSIEIAIANSSTAPGIVAVFGQNNTLMGRLLDHNSSLVSWKEYLDAGSVAYLYRFGNGTGTNLYYSSIIYSQGQMNYPFWMYIVSPGGYAVNGSCISAYDLFYNTLSNLAALNPGAFSRGLDGSYCSVSRMIR